MLPVLGVWALCSLVGVFLAEHRGRWRIEGFMWGALLGPIGLLIMALGPDFRPYCSECGGVLAPEARRCRHCGSVITG